MCNFNALSKVNPTFIWNHSAEKYRETPWLYAEDTALLKAEAVMREISEKGC